MSDLTILDAILLVVALCYLVLGWRRGLFLTLGSIVGFGAGAVAAFYLTPLLTGLATGWWRVVVALASLILLISIGQWIGVAMGRPLKRLTGAIGLGFLDRIGGAVLNLLAFALVVVILSYSASSLGVASITTTVNRSKVISALESLTPDPVQQGIARAREAVLAQSGIPQFSQQLFPEQKAPTTTQSNAALEAAADSVVKVDGTAQACMQNQSGSGFVTAEGMVVTNAHVVAGVTDPEVETRSGTAYEGEVVYFDSTADLAVISVPDLKAAALGTGQDAASGDLTTFMGYPLGGSFSAKSATVQGLEDTSLRTENGTMTATREVYQLAADVQQGNSGGPLLNAKGQVIGVIFAKATTGQTGFALSMKELSPVLAGLDQDTSEVSTGQCTSE